LKHDIRRVLMRANTAVIYGRAQDAISHRRNATLKAFQFLDRTAGRKQSATSGLLDILTDSGNPIRSPRRPDTNIISLNITKIIKYPELYTDA
jgi:hypothetical protein